MIAENLFYGDLILYYKCNNKKCNYHFKLQPHISKTMKKQRTKLLCPVCNGSNLSKTTKHFWALSKDLRDQSKTGDFNESIY